MYRPTASFPTQVWDGLSENAQRQTIFDDVTPDYRDFDRLVSEIIATQNYVSGTDNLNFVTYSGRTGGQSITGPITHPVLTVQGGSGLTSGVKLFQILAFGGFACHTVDKNGYTELYKLRATNTIEASSVSYYNSTFSTYLGQASQLSTRSGSAALGFDVVSGRPFQLSRTFGLEAGPILTTLASATPLTARAAASQTAEIARFEDNNSAMLSGVSKNGGFIVASMADSAAVNGTIYFSTTQSKLVYKGTDGLVNALY